MEKKEIKLNIFEDDNGFVLVDKCVQFGVEIKVELKPMKKDVLC